MLGVAGLSWYDVSITMTRAETFFDIEHARTSWSHEATAYPPLGCNAACGRFGTTPAH
jgi:hypothetical protein